MKTTFLRLLSLFLSWQLLAGPVLNLPTGVVFAMTEDECNNTPGMEWNVQGRRCIRSSDVIRTGANARACARQDDPQCFVDNASTEIQNSGDMPSNRQNNGASNTATLATVKMMVPLIISLSAGIYAFQNKSSTCTATSYRLLIAGGYALAIGELAATILYNKKLKNLAKNYKNKIENPNVDDETGDVTGEEASNDQSTTRINLQQSQAFTFLAKQEDARQKAENTRGSLYMIAGAVYTAAAIAAGLEALQITNQAAYTCTPSAAFVPEKSTSDELIYANFTPVDNRKSSNYDEHRLNQVHLLANYGSTSANDLISKSLLHEMNKESEYNWENLELNEMIELISRAVYKSLIPEAQAAEQFIELDGKRENHQAGDKFAGFMLAVVGTSATIIASVATGAAVLKALYTTPISRIATGGVLAGYAYAIGGVAFSAAQKAKRRERAINEMKERFNLTGGASTATCESRDDMTQPRCYCYNEDGGRNESRQNQRICQTTWGRLSDLKGTNYDANDTYTTGNGLCIQSNGSPDEACSCRQNTGSSKCARVQANFSLPGLTNASWINEPTNAANNLFNGNTSGADLSEDGLNSMAMRMRKRYEKLASNPQAKKIMDEAKKRENETRALLEGRANKVLGSREGQALAASLANRGGDSSTTDTVPTEKDAIAKANEEVKQLSIGIASDSKKGNDMLDFGLGGADTSGITIEDDMAKILDDDFKVTGDIHNNSSHNIFHILSNRYMRSALPRFFDKERKTQLDEANESEINDR